VEQCDGLTLLQIIEQPTTAPKIDADETCEAIVTGWENRPALHLTSATECRAFYRPSTDSVHMPVRSRFVDAPHYYSTLFHELVHSTGHESRLNRTFGDRFGDELYSKEELVAEMGAAFLCAIAEIANEHTDRNTTAYIQNWISKLEEDNRLIVHAAANAQRAVDSTLLTESKTNPRRIFEENALKELAETIRSQGVLSPLLVRPTSERGFEIVFGARRYRAAQLAEVATVRVRIKNLTDAEVLEAQLIENLQRRDVHPMEEANGFRALLNLEEPKYSIEQIAAKTGKSPVYVAALCGQPHNNLYVS
jgi:ParB/RepB/Spo0J family partition protein